MASPASVESSGRTDAAIAIFDLDGTLTRSDTLFPYLAGFVGPRPARWLRLASVGAALLAYLAGRLDRDACKERIVRSCLGGAARAELAVYTDRFVTWLLGSGMRNDALAVLESHRASGARLVLLSASPDVYVSAIAARLGFHECVCTELSWSAERLIGTFASSNRRAEEKSTVVRAIRQRAAGRIAAYANSSSDLPHLELTDEPLLVNGSAAARRAAVARGIPCEPWN
jgi:phosphatidylglycerophosphatase C